MNKSRQLLSEPSSKIERFLENFRGKKTGLFIDSANWFYPQKELGWKISYSKLVSFLGRYCDLKSIYFYAGTPLDNNDRAKFDQFRKKVQEIGFTVVTKPLKKIWINTNKNKFDYKCNFDVEIALDVARYIDKIDIIIIGSGDSDFIEIKNYALEHGKRFTALCFEKGVAWEVRKLHHIFLEEIRHLIEHKKAPTISRGVNNRISISQIKSRSRKKRSRK